MQCNQRCNRLAVALVQFQTMRTFLLLLILYSSASISLAQVAIRQKDQLDSQDGPAHLGSIAEGLVGIEVINTAQDGSVQQKRWGNGFVLRCDGFILAPYDLFSKTMTVNGKSEVAGKQSVTVILNPGQTRQKRIPAAAPRFHGRDIGYAVVRLHGFHSAAVKSLLAGYLKTDSNVEVAWAPLDPATGKPVPLVKRTAKLAPAPAEGSDLAKQGLREFAEAIENVPAGAVVTGPDGMAIGMVAGSGTIAKAERFTTFSVLHKATNCVTAAAIPDSDPGPTAEQSNVHFSPMVPVVGGQMLVSVAIDINQPDLDGEPFACIAPFLIDQFEVTNEEYYVYWKTIPESERKSLGTRMYHYPLTWAPWPIDPPFTSDIARTPVLGVPLPGAMAYARWRGKRLPTPYEWSMAAFGNRGDSLMAQWAGNYIGERNAAWIKIKNFHMEYLRIHTELHQAGMMVGSIAKLPWISKLQFTQYATAWSKETINGVLNELWTMWKDPLYVLPVGSRDFDVSPCGANDMILNASEMVMPSPTLPALGAARYMEIAWIPQKPSPQDPWGPRTPEAMTDGGPLPPLSRLYRRNVIGPTAADIVLWSNINEAVQMMGPLSGWQLKMTGDVKSSASMWQTGRSPYEQLGRPSGFQLWEEKPPHFRVEMGHPIPLDAPDRGGPGAQLYYYLPTGFRCAR
jgi:formylglycine-generating enzyme required for sulfatase activity